MTTKPTTRVFNYIRGAIRSTCGTEDFRHKNILVVGVNTFGQNLISKICFDEDVHIYFEVEPGKGLKNYLNAFSVCSFIEPWNGEKIDVTVDTLAKKVKIGSTITNFDKIGEDSYTQGLHDFYL